jgi:hypothetical protein
MTEVASLKDFVKIARLNATERLRLRTNNGNIKYNYSKFILEAEIEEASSCLNLFTILDTTVYRE